MTALEHVCLISVHIKSKKQPRASPAFLLRGPRGTQALGIPLCSVLKLREASVPFLLFKKEMAVFSKILTFLQMFYVSYNVSLPLYLEIKIPYFGLKPYVVSFSQIKGCV